MSLLRERHTLTCPCSICGELQHAGPYSCGILTPLDKTWNAWRWLFIITPTARLYLRWNGFWQRQRRSEP